LPGRRKFSISHEEGAPWNLQRFIKSGKKKNKQRKEGKKKEKRGERPKIRGHASVEMRKGSIQDIYSRGGGTKSMWKEKNQAEKLKNDAGKKKNEFGGNGLHLKKILGEEGEKKKHEQNVELKNRKNASKRSAGINIKSEFRLRGGKKKKGVWSGIATREKKSQ